MSLLRLLAVAVLTALLSGCGKASPPSTRHTEVVTTADGVALKVELSVPNAGACPGVVLVHGVGQTGEVWSPLVARLVGAGFGCAVLDLRGHGGSTKRQGRTISHESFGAEEWGQCVRDISAARDVLVNAGVDPRNVAVVGAGVGANLALRFGALDDGVEAVVLVSPGLNYEGVRTERAVAVYGKRPLLLVTSEGDAYAAESCRKLKAGAPGFAEILEFSGSAHGTDLFIARPPVIDQIAAWLDEVLVTDSGGSEQPQ